MYFTSDGRTAKISENMGLVVPSLVLQRSVSRKAQLEVPLDNLSQTRELRPGAHTRGVLHELNIYDTGQINLVEREQCVIIVAYIPDGVGDIGILEDKFEGYCRCLLLL